MALENWRTISSEAEVFIRGRTWMTYQVKLFYFTIFYSLQANASCSHLDSMRYLCAWRYNAR
jgi:hypothetical protein